MKFYIIMWIATNYSCPWGLGSSPEAIKDLFCSRSQRIEYFMSSKKDLIEKKLGEVSGGSVVKIHGGRINKLDTRITVEEK